MLAGEMTNKIIVFVAKEEFAPNQIVMWYRYLEAITKQKLLIMTLLSRAAFQLFTELNNNSCRRCDKILFNSGKAGKKARQFSCV